MGRIFFILSRISNYLMIILIVTSIICIVISFLSWLNKVNDHLEYLLIFKGRQDQQAVSEASTFDNFYLLRDLMKESDNNITPLDFFYVQLPIFFTFRNLEDIKTSKYLAKIYRSLYIFYLCPTIWFLLFAFGVYKH